MAASLDQRVVSVRGVVFDLDGTLVDSYGAIASSVNAARERFGFPRMGEEEVRKRVGRGLEALMAEVIGPENAVAGALIFREHYASVFDRETTTLPGAERTVRELHARGYRLAVASNKLARFGRPILERAGMAGFLDAIEGPDTAGATKPEPAMLERCLRAMGVAPSEAVYVGDMALDVESAARASVRALLVPGGSSSRDELAATGATLLGSIGDLLDLLPPVPSPSETAR